MIMCTDRIEMLKCVCDLTDCLSENEQYKNNAKMSRLIQWRQDEVKAVYHEKELLDVFLTMSHKLEEHMTGMVVMSGE